MKSFFRFCAALTLALLFTAPLASAAENTPQEQATAVISKFLADLGANNAAGMAGVFAKESSITDEFPPYYWHGANTFAEWGKDFAADSTSHKITEPVMKVGKIKTSRVTDTHAYVIAPAIYTAKEDGKPFTEHGLFTFALTKDGADWKISSMTWSIK